MYTVEFEHDVTTITIMDESGLHGDLIVDAFDDLVYIRQYDPEMDLDFVLEIGPKQWEDLINAIHSPEGMFKTITK